MLEDESGRVGLTGDILAGETLVTGKQFCFVPNVYVPDHGM